MQNSAENFHYLNAAHRSHLSQGRRNYFLGIIISLLMLLGLEGPLHLAHASTTNGPRPLIGSLNVAHSAHPVPLLPSNHVLASMEQYIPGTTPVLYLPGTITVSATSSLGATVIYTVSASAPNNPASLPAITCIPPSASIFPIGTTTVLCSASDLTGNTTDGNFVVVVLSAAAQLRDLLILVKSFSSSAKSHALVTRLQNALIAVNMGQTAMACSDLTQFINLVEVQPRSGLTTSQVHQLLTAATRIQAVLAC